MCSPQFIFLSGPSSFPRWSNAKALSQPFVFHTHAHAKHNPHPIAVCVNSAPQCCLSTGLKKREELKALGQKKVTSQQQEEELLFFVFAEQKKKIVSLFGQRKKNNVTI